MTHSRAFCLDDIPECDRTETVLVPLFHNLPNRCLSRGEFLRLRPYLTPAIMAPIARYHSQAVVGLRALSPEVITEALEWAPQLLEEDLVQHQLPGQSVFPETFPEALMLRVIVAVPSAIRHLPTPTEALCLKAIETEPSVIEFIDVPSDAVMQRAVARRPEVIRKIRNPPRELVLEALDAYPHLLMKDNFIPRTIDGDTIEFYEMALGQQLNYSLLYPSSRPEAKVSLPLDAVFDPASRQVECLARTIRTLDLAKTYEQSSLTRYRLITDFLIPSLHALPLGSRYREAWRQPDGNGQWLLDWLEPLLQHTQGLSRQFRLPNKERTLIERRLARLTQQIEWGITSTDEQHASADLGGHLELLNDTL